MRLIEGGHYRYDLVTPSGVIADCTLGIPGWVNVENAVAAVAAMWCAARAEGGTLDTERLRRALAAFEGVKRRFEFYVNTPRQVYMDDYAHHPRELAAALTSVRRMFPGRRVTAVFQPHLYTRTRDFYREFAEALSQADEVLLLPIYPAREEPDRGHRLRDHRRTGHRTVPHRRPRSAGGDARRSRDRRGRQLRGGQHRRLLRCRGGRIA